MALLDYLGSRREEIEGQIKSLKAELSEIRIAETALTGGKPGKKPANSKRQRSVVREGSIKDWVLKALMNTPEGYETDNVIIAVNLIGGPDVPRNSMTPQLSRLKAMGLIEQEGRFWRLIGQQPQNDETPGVQPPDVPAGEDFSDLA